ncbi:unnamed protein product [Effrenium voratum]|uniref:N-acetyltransferase domain-containing protein n=1 Tax=Effrenium voratum TaxID=2562239 RepID=A0AA36IEQ2_9DINO|nr:unnamed protein product [Effrenium voratum]CAJ1458636.1 unnamed protein product [Effrenium voratum]
MARRTWSTLFPNFKMSFMQNEAARALPWSQVAGAELHPEVLAAAKDACEGGFELVVPEDEDMQGLTDLVDESFQRHIQDRMIDDGNPLSGLWNGWVALSERQMTLGAMRKRLAQLLQAPSLRRPSSAEWNLGVLLRRKGDAPVGYFELCVKQPEGLGRRPDSQPYLTNLCVAKACRGRGLGRKLLKLVEDFSRTAWQGNALYLHTDDDPAAFNLYNSSGYAVRKRQKDAEDHLTLYMYKNLAD